MIQRTIDAVDYQYKTGPTPVDMKGTVLLPDAKGAATVESKAGATEIDFHADHMAATQHFGREYLTYVLWAITPEGRPHNLGEIIPGSSDKGKLRVTTDLQAFGLLVTAEPYAAVREPSGVVVLENQIRPDTIGKAVPIQVHYELMAPGHYTYDVAADLNPHNTPMVTMDEYTATLELYQAQNAVQIAKARGAQQYAPEVYQKAEDQWMAAQRLHDERADKNAVVTAARTAYETAEDARVLAEKRKQDADAASQRAAVDFEKNLRQAAEANAATARTEAQVAQAQLASAQTQAQTAQAQVQTAQAAQVRAEDEAARMRETASAPPTVVVAPPPPPPAETLPPAGTRDETAAQRQLRRELVSDLSGTLDARDTPRGITLTVPDVDFHGGAINSFMLGPLARVASVMAKQPGLTVEVKGNSDAAGAEGLRFSEIRADSVRDALVRGGLPASAVRIRAMGNANPIGPNRTMEEKTQNRRVEIVVSGEAIGSMATWDKPYTLK